MSGETVVYKNDMNLVPLRKFNNTEVNLFFTLCNKLKDKGNLTVNVPFEELKELSNYYSHDKKLFIQDLEKFYRLNGAIYLCNSKRLIQEKTFFLKNDIYGFKMSREVSIDIDTGIDLDLAKLIKNRNK